MKRSLRQLTRTLVTGLLAALPLIVTVAVFIWLGRLLYAWLGPSSLVGQVFVGLGLGLSGSVMLGYVLGALIIVLGVYALGLLVEGGLQRGLVRLVNAVVSRIPLVRNVYDLISRFVDLLSQNGDDGHLVARDKVLARQHLGRIELEVRVVVEERGLARLARLALELLQR